MKHKKLIFTVLTFLWVGVIFSFSLQPGEVSGDISSAFLEKILGWATVEVFGEFNTISQEQWNFLHHVLRKCAHFTEFMILGVLSTLTLFQTKVSRKTLIAMGFCIVIASMDETLQLFVAERAGRAADVLIDGMGAFCGVMFVGGGAVLKRRRIFLKRMS